MLSKITTISILIPIVAIGTFLYSFKLSTEQGLPMLKGKNLIPQTLKSARNMSTPTIPHAKIVPRPSSARGHADHGWLDSYHTFSFASYHDPKHMSFGSLRVLNEDRVAPESGFPTHPHRDAEIFSYILDGQLTHRDSLHGKGGATASKDDFYVMKRGDVQFTTGGTGIAHSEQNEHSSKPVHFLQIWVTPWARGLPPTYHTSTFDDEKKRSGFVTIISPLVGGPNATVEQEKAAVPAIDGTIPIHADFLMSAAIIAPGKTANWRVGGGVVTKQSGRHTYIHLPATKGGNAKVKVVADKETILSEGDGAYISGLNAGDELSIESIGTEEAELVVLDSD